MSSCFSRCLRVPIAIRAFYESYLWILQTLLLTHPDLHPGLLVQLWTRWHFVLWVRRCAYNTPMFRNGPKSGASVKIDEALVN